MEKLHDLNFVLPLIIGLFWSILFLQSGIDKISDWKGNLAWLKTHFDTSLLGPFVKGLLGILTFFELSAGLVSLIGVGIYLKNGNPWLISQGLILVMIALLMLFFGQRICKDYDGAKTIAIYFAVSLLSALILM